MSCFRLPLGVFHMVHTLLILNPLHRLYPFSEWRVYDGVYGESCDPDSDDTEKCEIPKLPDCIDRNIYCKVPNSSVESKVNSQFSWWGSFARSLFGDRFYLCLILLICYRLHHFSSPGPSGGAGRRLSHRREPALGALDRRPQHHPHVAVQSERLGLRLLRARRHSVAGLRDEHTEHHGDMHRGWVTGNHANRAL